MSNAAAGSENLSTDEKYQVVPGAEKFHESFVASDRPHALMITNHGIHQWKIIPGLPDTGGQNVFVNFFADALTELGYRVTLVNRGGFSHPKTNEPLKGLHYKSELSRLLYLEDGRPEFVRKEEMDSQLPQLSEELTAFLAADPVPVTFICTHYWDAAVLGASVNEKLPKRVPHIWVPHSLGAVKKGNVDPKRWEELRIDERIDTEKKVIAQLDGIASTSQLIKDSLKNDYDYETELFLPPCVDVNRYSPGEVSDDDPVWACLSEVANVDRESFEKKIKIIEVSRTDKTKKKDVLIKAFAKVHKENDNLFLLLTLDENQKDLYDELTALIESEGIKDSVAVLGSVWDLLPSLYRLSDIYCTPSVMEGFGMSIQEGAATGLPAVSSDLVPFAVEYLAGDKKIDVEGVPVKRGEGSYIVEANHVDGFATALSELANDEDLRKKMGARALAITVPYFTWTAMTKEFLKDMAIEK